MNIMKIAMFTDSYLPSRDGVVTSILLTKRELEALGHEVIIFAPEPPDHKQREDGVYYFKSRTFAPYQGYLLPIFPADNCRLLRQLNVDVIHAQGPLFMGLRGMFAARNLQLPIVFTYHTMVPDAIPYYNNTPLPVWATEPMMWLYLRNFLERADSVIAPTNSIKEVLKKSAPGMRHIEVIPTGVDLNKFHPRHDGSSMRERLNLNGEKVVLTVGRIAWEKNLELIIRGFKILHDVDAETKLVIAGKGPAENHYKNYAKQLGLGDDVLFPGFVLDTDLPNLYAACDAFTIASKFETQGLVLLEAMASGKPVSGIKYRAIPEIVEDFKNGFTFYENPECWAIATKMALEADPSIGINARKRAEDYSVEKCVRRTVDLYNYAIEAKTKRLAKKMRYRFNRTRKPIRHGQNLHH